MENSPFIFGSTVSKKSFTNRESEVQKLKQNLSGGINTMIISPRRWGKSSLVEKVIADINKSEKNVKTVLIDLFAVNSKEEFLERLALEVIKASSGKWEEWVKNVKTFFLKLVPKIQLSADPNIEISLSFDWKEIEKHEDEILNLPELIGKAKKLKFIICLDEFQNLSSIPDFESFEKKLRSIWQRHKHVSYCIYGSKRHMMTEIFNNPSRPFYRFGDLIMLTKISTEKWVKFICKSFRESGKTIEEEFAERIALLMQNHPWYVQQLSHYTWNMTEKKAGEKEIRRALQELIMANAPLYYRDTELLSRTQLNLLKAVVSGETQLTSSRVMTDYHLGTPRNVAKNKTLLIKNDIIDESKGKFEFVDPAFELWFRKQFFRQELG